MSKSKIFEEFNIKYSNNKSEIFEYPWGKEIQWGKKIRYIIYQGLQYWNIKFNHCSIRPWYIIDNKGNEIIKILSQNNFLPDEIKQ